MNDGFYPDAILAYDRALEMDPDNSFIWDNRGVALSRIGLMEESEESFEFALEIEPSNTQAWSNLGVTLASQRRFEEALNSFDQAVKLNENNDEANIISKNGRMAFFIIWFFIFLLHKDTIIFQIFSFTFPEKLSNKNDNKK